MGTLGRFNNENRQQRAQRLPGFHCFTEIGHIFNNKYTFNNQKHFSSLNLANTFLFEWLGNPGKGTLSSKNLKTVLGKPASGPH